MASDERLLSVSEVDYVLDNGTLPQGWEDESQKLDLASLEEEGRLCAVLGLVLPVLSHLFTTSSNELGQVLEKLAIKTREESWRVPMGKSGILKFVGSEVLAQGDDDSLKTKCLRLACNSCFDLDENRAILVEANALPNIVKQLNVIDYLMQFMLLRQQELRNNKPAPLLSIPPLAESAIIATYNVVVDYEPAQSAAFQAGALLYLSHMMKIPESLGHLQNESVREVFTNLVWELVPQGDDPSLVELDAPRWAFGHLANLDKKAENYDSMFKCLSSSALAILSHPAARDKLLSEPAPIENFLKCYKVALDSVTEPEHVASSEPPDTELQTKFLHALADLSDHQLFKDMEDLHPQVFGQLVDFLGIRPATEADCQSLGGICIALGNIASTDSRAISLVQKHNVGQKLAKFLQETSPNNLRFIHSALSCLKNLSIPLSNKPFLASTGLLSREALPSLWKTQSVMQDIPYLAVSLTRQLVNGCPGNGKLLYAGFDTATGAPPSQSTLLAEVIDVFKTADAEPTRAEAARTVELVCRQIHSDSFRTGDQSEDSTTSAPFNHAAFYEVHDVVPSLVYLVGQSKWPALRSEGWVVLAIMSQSETGASVAAQVIQTAPVLKALTEAITGRDLVTDVEDDGKAGSPGNGDGQDQGAASSLASQIGELDVRDPAANTSVVGNEEMRKTIEQVDRENGLVLVTQLLKNAHGDFTARDLDILRRSLDEGGKLLVSRRAEGSGRPA